MSISDVITDKSDYSEDLIGEEDREKDLEKIVNEDDDERVEDHEKEDLLGKKGAKKGKNEEGWIQHRTYRCCRHIVQFAILLAFDNKNISAISAYEMYTYQLFLKSYCLIYKKTS